ncbi:MAG: DDE-type integrase/transposase/recombinase [Pseudonocardiaceae bacterium]
MMAERGVIVSHESIRAWSQMFVQAYANGLRRRRPRPGDKWHLDEVFIKVNGQRHYLWRAVDQHGNVLEALSSCWVSRAMSCVRAGRRAVSRPRSDSRGQANDLVPGGEAGGHFVSVGTRGEGVVACAKLEQARSLIRVGQIAGVSSAKAAATRSGVGSSIPSS